MRLSPEFSKKQQMAEGVSVIPGVINIESIDGKNICKGPVGFR